VRGTRVGSEGEVFLRVFECLENGIDMRFVVCDDNIRQLFGGGGKRRGRAVSAVDREKRT